MHTVDTSEATLYIDLQAARPAAFCRVCGGELYFPGCSCLRCRRRDRDLSPAE